MTWRVALGAAVSAFATADVPSHTSGAAMRQQETLALRHQHLYSIIWSARPSSEFGTVIPKVLAVFRLIAIIILVACITGISAGFSPLNAACVAAHNLVVFILIRGVTHESAGVHR